jgi:ABC-2 type transport system permease protein
LRQPRLIASLVLGPFLILFLFGIGYRDQNRNMRTILVVPPNSAISAKDIQAYITTMIDTFTVVGTSTDLNSALAQLKQHQVEMVIAEPPDVMATIKDNHQAIFTIYHNEIDPVQVDFINYLGWLFTGAINQQVLLNLTTQGQKDASHMEKNLQQAHQNITALKQAIQSGDQTLSQQKQVELTGNVDVISIIAGTSLGVLDSLQSPNDVGSTDGQPVQATVNDMNQNTSALSNNESQDQRLARLDKIDKDLTSLDAKLKVFQNLQPLVIVAPFNNETKSVADFQPTLLNFFVPAVLALLLQHVAVTFAALSIVRERNVGTVELFRISPISAGEALFGKYLSYMIFGGIIALALTILMTYVLHMPMLGNWWYYALTIAAILFTSLGFGFVISLISQTDSQAVQYSMIMLLASVFFSGFILGLERLSQGVKVLSWILPTTYGMVLLRDIGLRGEAPGWLMLGGLIGIGLVLMIISSILMRRLIGSSG